MVTYIATLMHGKAARYFSIRKGISNNVYVGSALIDMYPKCGKIGLSQLFFDRILSTGNLVFWNATKKGHSIHGKAKETMNMFHEMQSGQKPDLMSSYSFTVTMQPKRPNR